MLRFLVILPVLGALVLSLAAFEGAAQAENAFAVLEASLALDPPLREPALARATARVEQSWARPMLWNARTAEALSAIYALRAETSGDSALLAESVRAARRAVRLSPVQPRTWTRLAKLALVGAPGVPCTVEECLRISWLAAPLVDPETDCIRIRLWVEARLPIDSIRPHIRNLALSNYQRVGTGVDGLERCLSFLAPSERFQYLTMARAQQNAPRPRRQTAPRR